MVSPHSQLKAVLLKKTNIIKSSLLNCYCWTAPYLHWLLEEQWSDPQRDQIPPRHEYFSLAIWAFSASLWWAGAGWALGWGPGWWDALYWGSGLSPDLASGWVQRVEEALWWGPGAAPLHSSHSNPPLGNHCLQEMSLSWSRLRTWMEGVWLVPGVRAPHSHNSLQIPHWIDYLMSFHHWIF